MRKHLEHFWWKSSDLRKNCLVAVVFATFIASCLVASAFMFWLQVQIANYLFN